MNPLPRLMVAPNGARMTKMDHPALPVTLPEIVACAVACHMAGADGLHAHVRDSDGRHVLDAGLYAELLAELSHQTPRLQVQITTEAAGRYRPEEQRRLVTTLRPQMVSIALREITAEPDPRVTRHFFAFCVDAGVAVQHILYDEGDVKQLCALVAAGVVPQDELQVLHVLGRYTSGQMSAPADLDAPLKAQFGLGLSADWAACAFGPQESDCLCAALRQGGKVRIGFENNFAMRDGSIARDNAQRVAEMVAELQLAKRAAQCSPGSD